jgi:hypothetical protein
MRAQGRPSVEGTIVRSVAAAILAGWLCAVAPVAIQPSFAAENYSFAVEAPDVPSLRIFVEAWELPVATAPAPKSVVDKKVSKRTAIGDKAYFVVKVPKAKALTGTRFCATVADGWLVKWNGGFRGDDGGPGRTLCTEVGPLTWLEGVTYLKLETRSEAAEIDLGQGFQYDIGPDVPPAEVTLIKTGFWIGANYINRLYGGDIPPALAKSIVVKIEASDSGNGCCSGLAEAGARPYFNVKDPNWAQPVAGRGWSQSTDKMKSVIDEYVHGWHATLGVLSLHDQPLGNWMNSGIAEYIAYSALVDAGRMKQKDADRMEFGSAAGDGELDPTLKSLQSTETPIWPGHAGYAAIKWLVGASPNGPLSLRILATSIGDKGMSVDDAFYTAFGVTLADFYPQFEVWKKAIKKNPVKAAANMPKLMLSTAPPVAAPPAAPAPPLTPAIPTAPAEKTADELFRLGYNADTGSDGVAKDDAEAFKWYTLAVAKGQHEAERNLAGMYGSGRGVAQNDAEARRLFHAAADGGDAGAQYALGKWYSEGSDDTIKWFRLAARQGHADAIAGLKELGVGLE